MSDDRYPTGTVRVTLDAGGHASYEIVRPSARDYIACEPAAEKAVQFAAFFVFGSLAARSEVSGAADRTGEIPGVRRQPPAAFFSPDLIRQLLAKADLAKMNDDELRAISGWFGPSGGERQRMTAIWQKFDLQGLIITRGEHGAAFLDRNGHFETPGTKATVQDTIGSGNAFPADFLHRKLENAAPETCLAFAGKMGAFVATQKGGTREHGGL